MDDQFYKWGSFLPSSHGRLPWTNLELATFLVHHHIIYIRLPIILEYSNLITKKIKSLFGQQKIITQFPSLNFHHSSLITHNSLLITHHSSLIFSHTFGNITFILITQFFHTIHGSHTCQSVQCFFFFFSFLFFSWVGRWLFVFFFFFFFLFFSFPGLAVQFFFFLIFL